MGEIKMAKIIGIDLGTSNSAAAFLEAGRPKIIPSKEGASLYGKAFPSVVAFTKDSQVLVGEPAKRQAVSNPEGTITAAALAYGLDKHTKEQKILVYDFGGGTLDVTLMEFGDGVFEVKSTSGDTQLGGKDMDDTIIKYITSEFKKKECVDLNDEDMAMQRLREAAEKAKIELSNVLETDINLPFITATNKGPKHLLMKLNRAKLEELIKPIIEKCRHPLEQAVKDGKLKYSEINKVILVGGPNRMPLVRKFVEDIVGKNAERGVDPMECVAQGAAVQAGVLAGEVKDILLLDVTPLTLGIET